MSAGGRAVLLQPRGGPRVRVTGYDTPFPYTLENDYLPLAPRILSAIRAAAAESA